MTDRSIVGDQATNSLGLTSETRLEVRLNDLGRQWRIVRDDAMAAVERVGSSGSYILAKEVERFESALASAWPVGHSVGTGNGLDALKWWREGLKEKVRDYCLKDVEITKRIFDYALEHGSVKYKELAKTHEVKLDTSKWLEPTSGAMTFSLGL